MAHVYFDRIRETSVTTGTGDFQLAGAVTGFRAFGDLMADGDTTDIEISMGSATESVQVRYNSGTNTLTRQLVHESSNGGALVSFGTGTKDLFITLPAKVAQDILRRDVSLALTQMKLSELIEEALFMGDAGNRFADSFGALTYVDVAGATKLDSATTGVLKPTIGAPVQISNSGITSIGDMTGDAGLVAVFDGNISQNSTASASKAAASSGYAGKNYSASPKAIGSAIVNGSSDQGYAAVSTSVILSLRAKNGGAPSSATDGTSLGTTGTIVDVNGASPQTITSNDTTTLWDYAWVVITTAAGSAILWLAEAQFFAPAVTNNLTVASTALTAASAPSTAKIVARIKEVDSITLNTDLIFSVSRVGGTTYTAVTMTKKFTDPSGISVYESADLDISGQPSGTSMKWKAASANNKMFELNDIYLNWR